MTGYIEHFFAEELAQYSATHVERNTIPTSIQVKFPRNFKFSRDFTMKHHESESEFELKTRRNFELRNDHLSG